MKPLHRLALLVLPLLPACASSEKAPAPPTPVDGALLAELDVEALAPVGVARAARDEALDARAAARGEIDRAENAIELAKADVRVREAELAAAELAARVADRQGTDEDHAAALHGLDVAKLRLESARQTLAVRRQEKVAAERSFELAESRLFLRRAELELAKARAVRTLERPATAGIDVASFKNEVARREATADGDRKARNAALRELEGVQDELRGIRIDLLRMTGAPDER